MSLPSPPSPAALAEFPAIEAGPQSTWYRLFRAFDARTGARREPLLFSASGQGRFDPPGTGQAPAAHPPYGTCYFGESLMAAYVEKFGDFGVLQRAQVQAFQVIAVQSPDRPRRLADVSDGRVLGQFGLTKEVCDTDDYGGPQDWSLALFQAGFDGIAYAPKHDPVGDLRTIALFGPPGPAEVAQVGLSRSEEGPIPESAIGEAASRYHLFVI